jgi:hypothetical protein
LTADDRLRSDIIERIMCDLEVDIEAVTAEHGADAAPIKAAAAEGMPPFEEDGLASWDGRRIVVGERGRPFVRSIAALFDAYLTRTSDQPRYSRAVQAFDVEASLIRRDAGSPMTSKTYPSGCRVLSSAPRRIAASGSWQGWAWNRVKDRSLTRRLRGP